MSWTAFDESAAGAWDAFVAAQPGGRMVHLTGFRSAVAATYGLEPFYRVYRKGGEIRAVFPGFFHASRVYGRKILSQPFSEYGGLLLGAAVPAAERDAILDEFAAAARRALRLKRFAHLEMRSPLSLSSEEASRFHTVPLFKRAVRRLDAAEAMWKGLDPKDRNIVQKARSYGLTFAEEPGADALDQAFYPLYLATMKRLGTPPHPLAYFLRLSRGLERAMKVFLVRFRGRPVAALVAWAVGTTVHVTDMCSDEAAFFLKPNDFAVWEFLRWARESGFETFDFGPVRYRGQEIFKKKWRMELRDYSYVYVTDAPSRIRNTFSGGGGLMAAAPGIWKTVMPVGLTRLFGKCLRREVGL
jgi:CelD/BcsL family acetyltransferase involved in cellulose biosynthesis